jgi:hypothetical protein
MKNLCKILFPSLIILSSSCSHISYKAVTLGSVFPDEPEKEEYIKSDTDNFWERYHSHQDSVYRNKENWISNELKE